MGRMPGISRRWQSISEKSAREGEREREGERSAFLDTGYETVVVVLTATVTVCAGHVRWVA